MTKRLETGKDILAELYGGSTSDKCESGFHNRRTSNEAFGGQPVTRVADEIRHQLAAAGFVDVPDEAVQEAADRVHYVISH